MSPLDGHFLWNQTQSMYMQAQSHTNKEQVSINSCKRNYLVILAFQNDDMLSETGILC